jgi:hypothetical protein
MASALLRPRNPVVFGVIHDPQHVQPVGIEHPSDQTVPIIANIEYNTVANLIR